MPLSPFQLASQLLRQRVSFASSSVRYSYAFYKVQTSKLQTPTNVKELRERLEEFCKEYEGKRHPIAARPEGEEEEGELDLITLRRIKTQEVEDKEKQKEAEKKAEKAEKIAAKARKEEEAKAEKAEKKKRKEEEKARKKAEEKAEKERERKEKFENERAVRWDVLDATQARRGDVVICMPPPPISVPYKPRRMPGEAEPERTTASEIPKQDADAKLDNYGATTRKEGTNATLKKEADVPLASFDAPPNASITKPETAATTPSQGAKLSSSNREEEQDSPLASFDSLPKGSVSKVGTLDSGAAPPASSGKGPKAPPREPAAPGPTKAEPTKNHIFPGATAMPSSTPTSSKQDGHVGAAQPPPVPARSRSAPLQQTPEPTASSLRPQKPVPPIPPFASPISIPKQPPHLPAVAPISSQTSPAGHTPSSIPPCDRPLPETLPTYETPEDEAWTGLDTPALSDLPHSRPVPPVSSSSSSPRSASSPNTRSVPARAPAPIFPKAPTPVKNAPAPAQHLLLSTTPSGAIAPKLLHSSPELVALTLPRAYQNVLKRAGYEYVAAGGGNFVFRAPTNSQTGISRVLRELEELRLAEEDLRRERIQRTGRAAGVKEELNGVRIIKERTEEETRGSSRNGAESEEKKGKPLGLGQRIFWTSVWVSGLCGLISMGAYQ